MNTTKTKSGGDTFTDWNKEHGRGRGCLDIMGEALAQAGYHGTPTPHARQALGVEARSVAQCLNSCERAAGTLLKECQGQSDIRLAERCVVLITRRMAGAGRVVERPTVEAVAVYGMDGKQARDERGKPLWRERVSGGQEWRNAIAAGVEALQVWRETGAGEDGQAETLATRVAWRAVVRAFAHDWLGESVPLHTVGDDWLWHNAEQRGESLAERIARRQVERQALGRQALLLRRLDNVPRRRGRRSETIDKLRIAACALLDGASLDAAAARAGFNARGGRSRHSAADSLIQACKRLGIISPLQSGQGMTARSGSRVIGHSDRVQVPERVGGKPVVISDLQRRLAEMGIEARAAAVRRAERAALRLPSQFTGASAEWMAGASVELPAHTRKGVVTLDAWRNRGATLNGRAAGRVIRRFVCGSDGVAVEWGVLQNIWQGAGVIGSRFIAD